MELYLLRHGETAYNAEKRYQGQRDIPLSQAGRAALRPAGFAPDLVYVSLCAGPERPPPSCSPLPDRSQYLILPRCTSACSKATTTLRWPMTRIIWPGWAAADSIKSPAERARRNSAPGPVGLLRRWWIQHWPRAGTPSSSWPHGGTQMAVLERYALPRRGYYNWNVPPAGGFLLETDLAMWQTAHTLQLREEVHCTW